MEDNTAVEKAVVPACIAGAFSLIVACAPVGWHRPGTSQESATLDRAACYLEVAERVPVHAAALREAAALLAAGASPLAGPLASSVLHEAGIAIRVARCMQALGYRLEGARK